MTDLQRAWGLLREGERPEGMRPIRKGGSFKWRDGLWHMTRRAARDRLIVAVEDVLLRAGWTHRQPPSGHVWYASLADMEDQAGVRRTDRLAAACDALERERGDG